MIKGQITKLALRAAEFLDRSGRDDSKPQEPAHLQTGRQGEDAAYFYLREHGYVMVARNFRSPRHRGEIDLIGWDADVLCFIEVKTRGRRGIVPAQVAVDGPKRSLLRATAYDYLRRLKSRPPVRFDVISIYFHRENRPPDINLFKNAFPMS